MRAFFFHYNKPLSRMRGKPQITVHIGGACHVVDNVDCRVPTIGRLRKRQPFFVMSGKARHFKVVRAMAVLS